MEKILYDSLNRYFKALSQLGYLDDSKLYTLLTIILIRDFIYHDFRGLITEADYRIIERALYKIFGSTCLVPYETFCNTEDMNKLHLGDISELAYRINKNAASIAINASAIANNANKIATLDNKVTKNEKDINLQYARITTLESGLDSVGKDIKKVEIQGLNTLAIANEAKKESNEAKGKVDEIKDIADTISSQSEDAIKRVETMEATLGTYTESISTLQSDVKTHTNDINSIKESLEDQTDTINNIETDLTTLHGNVTDINTEISNIKNVKIVRS